MTLQTSIAEAVLDQAEDILKDPTNGINPVLSAVCAQYGVTPIQFDLTVNSRSFWRAHISPTDLDESSIAKYPYLMLYTLSEQDANIRRAAVFSGYVAIAWDAWISWKVSSAQRDMEKPGNAVTAAFWRVFFDQSASWGAMAPRKNMTVKRGAVVQAGESWLQGIHGALVVEMDAN